MNDRRSQYDAAAIRAAIQIGLDPFIPATTLPLGRDAIIGLVTDSALYALELIAGRPDGQTPVGLMMTCQAEDNDEAGGCAECGRTAWEIAHEGHAIECSEYW